MANTVAKVCAVCERPFHAKRNHALYCSRACAAESWRRRHPGKAQANNRKYYAALSAEAKAERAAELRKWRAANPERTREYKRREYVRIRTLVLEHYGGQCACCGEAETAFLGIDHIDGGGRQHRAAIRTSIIRWLWRNDLPDGYRVLCHNCNQATYIYGTCPHQK